MVIELALENEKSQIMWLDRHIPMNRLGECIERQQIYVLKDDFTQTDHRLKNSVVGVLRYSLFWQIIPFLDLLYIDEAYRKQGFGTKMMEKWETEMRLCGYAYVMTSTQADEEAWRFYEKLGYRKKGEFFPPEQEAEEWIYWKKL